MCAPNEVQIPQSGWTELETRLPRNASHICAAAAAENSVFVMGADFSGKVRLTMMVEVKRLFCKWGFFGGMVTLVWKSCQPPQQVLFS